MLEVNKIKYENAILFLCKSLGGSIDGKKKLAKLLYYIDFDFFEYKESMKSVTGDSYIALPMGPVPSNFTNILDVMKVSKKIIVHTKEIGAEYIPMEIYSSSMSPDMSVFNEDEKFILNRVVSIYGGLNGKQLEDLTHAEAPWNGVELKNIIPYELGFYRETDFSK